MDPAQTERQVVPAVSVAMVVPAASAGAVAWRWGPDHQVVTAMVVPAVWAVPAAWVEPAATVEPQRRRPPMDQERQLAATARLVEQGVKAAPVDLAALRAETAGQVAHAARAVSVVPQARAAMVAPAVRAVPG